jgi:DNA-binding Lrp family transcriptional regulator
MLKDGRKSFRQISRETGISTPTVKARFDRLVNIGFIKSVSPILDFKKVNYNGNLLIDNTLLQATQNKIQNSRSGVTVVIIMAQLILCMKIILENQFIVSDGMLLREVFMGTRMRSHQCRSIRTCLMTLSYGNEVSLWLYSCE